MDVEMSSRIGGQSQSSETRIAKALRALEEDHLRTGQPLARGRVEAVVHRRGLEPNEIIDVFRSLTHRGLIAEELEDDSELDAIRDVELELRRAAKRGDATASDFLATYFSHPLLSPKEERELGRRIQLGLMASAEIGLQGFSPDLDGLVRDGKAAKDKLIRSNLRLVMSIAVRFRRGIDLPDAVQDGALGLIRAADGFDPDLGFRFTTYARWWIRQAVGRGADDFESTIRIPIHMLEKVRKFRRTVRHMTAELSRTPRISEIAASLNWPPDQVAFVERIARMKITSLDEPVGNEEDRTKLADFLIWGGPTPEEEFASSERRAFVDALLSRLAPRTRSILERRFGLAEGKDETLQQIADDYGLTRERIRQIEANGLKKLLPRAKYMKGEIHL